MRWDPCPRKRPFLSSSALANPRLAGHIMVVVKNRLITKAEEAPDQAASFRSALANLQVNHLRPGSEEWERAGALMSLLE